MYLQKLSSIQRALFFCVLYIGSSALSNEQLIASNGVHRSEPCALTNPFGGSIPNAMLQAWLPIMDHVMHLHALRTGKTLGERDWEAMLRGGACSRPQLMTIALGKVALWMNSNHQATVATANAFCNKVLVAQLGNDKSSLNVLNRDLIEGIADLTQARGSSCVLGVDREIVDESAIDVVRSHLEQERSRLGALPDFLVLDTGGMLLREILNASTLSLVNPSQVHELGIPHEIVAPDGNGSMVRYEMCSFVSLERSVTAPFGATGMVRRISDLFGLVANAGALSDIISYSSAPLRAVTTARYGNRWFIIDDGCVWKVAQPEGYSVEDLGSTLLRVQPGRRALVFYRKSIEVSCEAYEAERQAVRDASVPVVRDLTCVKISSKDGVSRMERPTFFALSLLLARVVESGAAVGLYAAAWRYAAQFGSSWTRAVLYFGLLRSIRSVLICPLSAMLNDVQRYTVLAKRYSAFHIDISADAPHRLSIYA